jgi:RimJ/RimL family protein N-acetyltransferase
VTGLRLRRATAADSDRLWRWRNDAETRRASFSEAEVPRADHERWLAETLARSDRRLYVAVAGDADVGTARLDVAGDEAVVNVTVAPEWRGRGVATALLRALVDEAFADATVTRLVARVRASNPASRAAFERAGFRLTADGEVATLVRERAGAAVP